MRLPYVLLGLFSAVVVVAVEACNGNVALCDRSYSNVSLIGTHGSAFVGILPTNNQRVSVTRQLDAGIRFLQAQTHNFSDEVKLCHSSCLLRDAGPLVDYLHNIKSWLDVNPDQVVTLLLTNQDVINLSKFDALMSASGLRAYAYTPPKQLAMSEWPTLRQLIETGSRLVMFMDYYREANAVAPYILDEFTYFFETPYNTIDPTFNQCNVDRPPGVGPAGRMMLVNHYLDKLILGVLIPDTAANYKTNAATGVGSIGAQSDLCVSKHGRSPNVVLVDNFDRGNVFAAQNALNHLP